MGFTLKYWRVTWGSQGTDVNPASLPCSRGTNPWQTTQVGTSHPFRCPQLNPPDLAPEGQACSIRHYVARLPSLAQWIPLRWQCVNLLVALSTPSTKLTPAQNRYRALCIPWSPKEKMCGLKKQSYIGLPGHCLRTQEDKNNIPEFTAPWSCLPPSYKPFSLSQQW